MHFSCFFLLRMLIVCGMVRNSRLRCLLPFGGNCIFVHGSTTVREGFCFAFRAAQSNVSDGTRLLC